LKKIVLHGRDIDASSHEHVRRLLALLDKYEFAIYLTRQLEIANRELDFGVATVLDDFVPEDFDAFFSLGGDGTFLETLTIVGNSDVPILGINTGRLGFLATIAKDQIHNAITKIMDGKYKIEERTLLALDTDGEIFEGKRYALNEFTILRKETSSMIVIRAYLDGNYLSTYWADGIMVSTPTGSTGYSLSCGGPIMLPHTSNFIITPVSPHNLNIRPLIVPDTSEIAFEVESRNLDFLVSLDSRSETVQGGLQLKVRKSDFNAKLIKIEGDLFVDTLRNKLNWGLDKRN
jgi:NAD+ kinase